MSAELRRSAAQGSTRALHLRLRLQRLALMGPSSLGVLVVAGLFAELLLAGGDSLPVAMLFTALWLFGLSAMIILVPWARQALARASYLAAPTLLFLAVLAWAIFQAAPLFLDLSKNNWAYVPGHPSISLDAFATGFEALKLAGLGALFLIGVMIGRDDDRAHAVWNAFGVFGAAYVAWSLLAFYQFTPPSVRSADKLTATLSGANQAATIIAVLAVLAWTALLRVLSSFGHQRFSTERLNAGLRNAAPWIGLLIVSLGSLSLTGSRGGAAAALGGILVSTAVMAWGEARDRRTAFILLGSVAVALTAFAALTLSSGATAARLLSVDSALGNRKAILGVYIDHIADAPWTGFGLGTFRAFNNLLVQPGQEAVLWDLGALHNVYLQWIFEAGWPGALVMFATVAILLAMVLGGLVRRKFGRTWIVGTLGATSVVLVHGLVDFGLQVPAIAGVWSLILGVGVGVSRAGAASRTGSR